MGPEKQTVTVPIPRGIRASDSLSSSGLTFVVQESPHPVFARLNNDLMLTVKVTLTESLTGVERKITHLDGRVITIRSGPVRSGDVSVVRDEGMPVRGGEGEVGRRKNPGDMCCE